VILPNQSKFASSATDIPKYSSLACLDILAKILFLSLHLLLPYLTYFLKWSPEFSDRNTDRMKLHEREPSAPKLRKKSENTLDTYRKSAPHTIKLANFDNPWWTTEWQNGKMAEWQTILTYSLVSPNSEVELFPCCGYRRVSSSRTIIIYYSCIPYPRGVQISSLKSPFEISVLGPSK